MNIEYLTYLRDNPIKYPNDLEDQYPIKGIPLSEIEALETKYNNGNVLPKALRELFFLAGDDCYVLDYGPTDSQEEIQSFMREYLIDYGNTPLTRPFFVIDCYNYGDDCEIVYLDEGDNPPPYTLDLIRGIVYNKGSSLKGYITELINRVKEGLNPF